MRRNFYQWLIKFDAKLFTAPVRTHSHGANNNGLRQRGARVRRLVMAPWLMSKVTSGAPGGARAAFVTPAHVSVREEGARRVVRVVQQLKLELIRLDAFERERVRLLAARPAAIGVAERVPLGRVFGLDAFEPEMGWGGG